MLNLNSYSRIVVYQFGKCGSTSLLHLFTENKNNVLHTHHDDFVNDNTKGKQLIITVTRNLIDKNISAFFQNMTNTENNWCVPKKPSEYKTEELIELYRKKNLTYLDNVMKNWYSNFNKKLNVNIFSKKFDMNKKYITFDNPKYTVLVMRYEDISEWNNILKNVFSNNKLPQLPCSNVTKKKDIGDIFVDFKKKYKISKEELDDILNIDVMKNFYTMNELKQFKEKYQ